MAHAEGQHTPRPGSTHPPRRGSITSKGSSIRSASISRSGDCCSFSAPLSYLVDYFHFQGYLRWTLIIVFMLLKAGLIVAVFMHMLWERLAMVYAILLPPLLLLVLLGIGAGEADYTFFTRSTFFGPAAAAPPPREACRNARSEVTRIARPSA